MWRFRLLLSVAALAWSTAASAAVDPAAVMVQDVHPEKFTDVGSAFNGGTVVDMDYVQALNRHLQKRAAKALGPGQLLQVEISDIDMAGEFEGWHHYASNVRFVRDVYPPRIDLHFILMGADGAVVKDGERKLRDIGFADNVAPYRDDPLRYEKALIDAWVEHEFGAAP
ncbi:MAG TPA: DUF3016 domain-containing protein [Burkholderiales bacterium]